MAVYLISFCLHVEMTVTLLPYVMLELAVFIQVTTLQSPTRITSVFGLAGRLPCRRRHRRGAAVRRRLEHPVLQLVVVPPFPCQSVTTEHARGFQIKVEQPLGFPST